MGRSEGWKEKARRLKERTEKKRSRGSERAEVEERAVGENTWTYGSGSTGSERSVNGEVE